MSRILLLLGLFAACGVVGSSAWSWDQTVQNGTRIYVSLGGFDPRSVMAGDYMRLRPNLRIPWRDGEENPSGEGTLVLAPNDDDVYVFARWDGAAETENREVVMRYRTINGRVQVLPESWFIEEGTDDEYENLSFAEVRVGADGRAVMVGLADVDREPLGRRPPRW